MKIIPHAVVFAAAMLIAPIAAADDPIADVTDLAAMQKAVQADKKAFIASHLRLTDAEAKKFWPIYDSYQRDLDMNNQKRNLALVGLAGQDKPLSDIYAKTLTNDLTATDEAEIKARRSMQNKLMRVLPPKKAARYLQLEAKIRAAQAYSIAQGFPLVH